MLSLPTDALDGDPQAALGTFPYPTAPAEAELIAIRRPLARAIDAILAVTVGGMALAAVAVAILAAFGTHPRIEASDSMRPVLRSGDVMWVHRIAAREARPGDVVAFRDPHRNRTLVHRVRAIHRGRRGRLLFVTRGDANGASERWQVESDGALGRYTGLRLPAVGRVAAALHGLPVVIAGAAGCLLLAGLTLRRIWAR